MKHSFRWWWSVGLGGLAACTVPDLSKLGPYTCEDSSSCAPGYSCVQGVCSTSSGGQLPPPPSGGDVDSGTLDAGSPDSGVPDAGPSDAGLPDTTPPVLTLSVPSPPANRDPVGRTTYTEPGTDGRPLPAAWRRDQTVTVDLRTDSTLTPSLTLTGTDGVAVPVDVVPYTSGCDTVLCARAVLSLWKPRLDASRGTLTVTATAKDAAGNTTVQKASVLVTRWKWAYDVFSFSESNSVEATPAIGAKGTIYVATYNTTFIAVSPEGSELWYKPSGGEGILVVGRPPDGRELIYARNYWSTSSDEGSQLIVYDAASAATGSPLLLCPATQTANLFLDSYALLSPGTSQEGVVAVTDGSASPLFLGLSLTGNGCQKLATSIKDGARGNLLLRGTVMFFGNTDADPTSVTVGSSTARSGWPVSSVTSGGINGLALAGDSLTLVMGEGYLGSPSSTGGLSTLSVNGGTAALKYTGGPVGFPVVGQGNIAYGTDIRSGQLVRTPILASGSLSPSAETSLDATLPPTLGQGGFIYAMFPSDVGVWSASDLKLQWKWSMGSIPSKAKRVAPTIDCTRDSQGVPIAGRPGVLYATIHNRVTALVVDSAGLDADAPWPKFQHDERNSGNSAVAVMRCP